MKKAILISTVVALILTGCANQGINPLSPDTEVLGSIGNPIHLVDISGTPIGDRDSVTVYPDKEEGWIYIHFDGVVDTLTKGILVEKTDGIKVPYNKEWKVSGGKTDLTLKPRDTLDYNTTYILKIITSKVSDINGNLLDRDGDGVGGESPDDYYIYGFTTFKLNGSHGDYAVNMEDKFSPGIVPGMYFLIGDSVVSDAWTDVDVAIDIYDLTWDRRDGSVVIVGADKKTIDETTVTLVSIDKGEEVALSDVIYGDDTSAIDFGRITVKPAHNLKPNTAYIMRLLGSIADNKGNKLWRYDNIAFEGEFTTLACNHDSSECREVIIPFTVVTWTNLGSSFEVEFSGKIDRNTITKSTIYLEVGGVRIGGILSVRDEGTHTIVRFSRVDGNSVSGTTAYVTFEISDLAGNRREKTETHAF